MEGFSNIVNWDSVSNQSSSFKNQTPFHFALIEKFFERDFYEKLYETYPKIDETWTLAHTATKTQLTKYWNDIGPNDVVGCEDDPQYSEEWNKFKSYAQSEEFVEKIRKFSGVPINKLKFFHFMSYTKGGFQEPHFHNVGPNTLVFMVYLSKNWKKGDPGGTYMASDVDESSIIFEPYNLDNSAAVFLDGPKSTHGVRLITKDIERRALQMTFEGYSTDKGWTGTNYKS
uniref:Prolyl 4-hydroxylase alpha subunit Fe(2+) 2OG dioxygenase domain-containing protein n=1 Tax=uncultured marine thaumarchaeote KM3_74_H09 TaxID=1456276 RepID=A0A075HNA8_9ARCH|nr:hypothetical protein [uncultured marine thaumarchaeote KM3_74_H09]